MIKFRVRSLISEREIRENTRITYSDVAQATGLSRNTIYNLAKNRTNMVRLNTLAALCKFFECQPGDLLYEV